MPTTSSYGSDPAQQLDCYRPTGSGKRAAVLVIPGGGWTSANREGSSAIRCAAFAALGYVGIAMSYRVVPDTSPAKQFEDVLLAYQWMKDQSFIDKTRIAVIGSSAGAYGAAWLSNRNNVKCAILECGIYDFTLPGVPEHPTVAAFLSGADPATSSPINFVSAYTKPTMLIHGAQDVTIDPQQSFAMRDRIASFGVPASLTLFTGGHGEPTDPAEAAAVGEAEKAFLASYL